MYYLLVGTRVSDHNFYTLRLLAILACDILASVSVCVCVSVCVRVCVCVCV